MASMHLHTSMFYDYECTFKGEAFFSDDEETLKVIRDENLKDVINVLKFMNYKAVMSLGENIMKRNMPTEMGANTRNKPNKVLVMKSFNTTAGNPVKKILLKLNLSDHRLFKDGGGVKEFQRSFRHSDTERLSRSDEVLKLKNFKKDATLKLSKSTNQESSRNKLNPEINDHYNIFTRESQEYELKTRDEA
ncbi:hypothetical protein Tco_1468161 [Tanacetum coccineum]